jgi:hypothetical protein
MTTAQQLALLTREEQAVPCARRHTLGHLDDCPGLFSPCLGCVFTPADVGHLCAPCYSTVRYSLRAIGEHIIHGWSTLIPSITKAPAPERVQSSRGWRLPWAEESEALLHAAYGTLASEAVWHAHMLAVDPPAGLHPATLTDRDITRIPVRDLTDTVGVRRYVEVVVQWELARTRPIVERAAGTAADLYETVVTLAKQLKGRFPMDPRGPELIKGLVCPICNAARIYLHGAGTEEPYLMCGVKDTRNREGSGCHSTWHGADIKHVITEGAAA